MPNPRDTTNSIQANGTASTNVISSPAVDARNATTNENVIAAVTNPVRSYTITRQRRTGWRHGRKGL